MLSQTPVSAFFEQIEGFDYDPCKPANHEFHRLCLCRRWSWGSPELIFAHDGFITALNIEFVERIGIFAMNVNRSDMDARDETTDPQSDFVVQSPGLTHNPPEPVFDKAKAQEHDTTHPQSNFVSQSPELSHNPPKPVSEKIRHQSKTKEGAATDSQSSVVAQSSGLVHNPRKPVSDKAKTEDGADPQTNFVAQSPGSTNNPRKLVPDKAKTKERDTTHPQSNFVTQPPGSTNSPRKSVPDKIRRQSKTKKDETTNHLSNFFAQYRGFTYDPEESVSDEFGRLMEFISWDPFSSDDDREEATGKYKDALTMQFNMYYGTDAGDIEAWRSLCTSLGIDPLPQTLRQCKEIFLGTHVNLVDLVDARRIWKLYGRRRVVQIFETVEQLSEYTKDTRKFFPRHNVHAGSLLNYLLRHIMFPERDMT